MILRKRVDRLEEGDAGGFFVFFCHPGLPDPVRKYAEADWRAQLGVCPDIETGHLTGKSDAEPHGEYLTSQQCNELLACLWKANRIAD